MGEWDDMFDRGEYAKPTPQEAYEALAAKLVEVTAERDRARATAVALEQQIAQVKKCADGWSAEVAMLDGRPEFSATAETLFECAWYINTALNLELPESVQ